MQWHKFKISAALLFIASSASASWEQTALRSQAFDLSHGGTEVTRRLFVTEDRAYVFALHLKPGHAAGEDHDSLRKLLRDARSRTDGMPSQASLAIPLRLKISVIEPIGERVVVDRALDQQQVDGMQGDAVWARIGRVNLQPGFYRLSVQGRKDMPELAHINASLEVSWTSQADSGARGSPEMMALVAQIRSANLLDHLSTLESLPLGATSKVFLRAESFAMPDELGVLDPCSHRMHLHRESGNFWIVRRCTGGVDIFRGVQPGPNAPVQAVQALAFRHH